MSWSVQAAGKPGAVKATLERQFAAAKAGLVNNPAELKACEAAEASVNATLSYLEEATVATGVSVMANGSAWGSDIPPAADNPDAKEIRTRAAGLFVQVQTLGGYVE